MGERRNYYSMEKRKCVQCDATRCDACKAIAGRAGEGEKRWMAEIEVRKRGDARVVF